MRQNRPKIEPQMEPKMTPEPFIYDFNYQISHLLTCPIYDKQRHEVCYGKDIIQLLNDNPARVLKYLGRIGRLTAPEL